MIGREFNGFKIIDSLGSGAFGHTYKVQKDRSIYAMKILKPEAMGQEIQSEGFKRFQREIRSLQKVKSEFVVKYYESGTWIDKSIEHYYIIMEFIEGMDFARYLKRNRKSLIADENKMKDLFSQILRGLHDIHKINILHRDLKPANVYITDNGAVKLLDFGLVKMLDYSTVTTKGKIVGTPLFMSPEMIEGKGVDYRSDLYSFGVLLYFICTEEYPFQGENVFVLLNNIVKQPPQEGQ
ncbi:MAG: serine/threonine-protein kinase [Thermodesulfobacteriota bacterium]